MASTSVSASNSHYAAGEALGSKITELCSHLYAAEYRLLLLIREFDEHKYWNLPGLCSCAHWLNFKCGIGMNAAREKVRVANALRELPKISAAFERGAVSYSKVRAMTRVANADNEDYLLRIATHGTAHHVERLVSKYRRVVRQRVLKEANERHLRRCVHVRYDDDGSFVIEGRLPPEQGALIARALEMAMERAFGEKPEDRAEVTDERPPEPFSARRADALSELAESYLNSGPVANPTADRYQVVVHVTAETSHLDGGPHVTADTAERLACDCTRLVVREHHFGEPLSIGRRSRVIPAALRRALWLRDGGCRFPGCTASRFVDGHHIEHWGKNGETSLENLILLCRHHHRLVHEGGFGCVKRPDGEVVFLDQRERPLPNGYTLPRLDAEQDAVEALYAEFDHFDINDRTCIPKWYAGEGIDWALAVGAMFRYDEKRERRMALSGDSIVTQGK